ncbi:hypothetical protein HOLleu_23109 [Holothuria leucospilota]|uniref:Uncharacterized protein n=1 Tax=Holothuria leucospilota TaxID=206669 RepID=A0A9Q1H4X8_HOLLE|nr:hypothetical protein HOLleu_23109 [Holothuria leucospilota]
MVGRGIDSGDKVTRPLTFLRGDTNTFVPLPLPTFHDLKLRVPQFFQCTSRALYFEFGNPLHLSGLRVPGPLLRMLSPHVSKFRHYPTVAEPAFFWAMKYPQLFIVYPKY